MTATRNPATSLCSVFLSAGTVPQPRLDGHDGEGEYDDQDHAGYPGRDMRHDPVSHDSSPLLSLGLLGIWDL